MNKKWLFAIVVGLSLCTVAYAIDLWFDVDTAISEAPVTLMPLVASADGNTIDDDVNYDVAGLDLVWNFVTTAGAYAQTAVTPTDTGGNYDWVEQGNGMFTIEIPASGGATINNDTEGFGWFTGTATGILPWRGPIIGFRAAVKNNLEVDDGTAQANQSDFYDGTGYVGGTIKMAVGLDASTGTLSDAQVDDDAMGTQLTGAEVAEVVWEDPNVPAGVAVGLLAHGLTAAAAAKLTVVYDTDAASYLDDANNTFRSTEAFMTDAFRANWGTVADACDSFAEQLVIFIGDMPTAATTITAQITSVHGVTDGLIGALTFTGDVNSIGGSTEAADSLKAIALAGVGTVAEVAAAVDASTTGLAAVGANETGDLIYARLGAPAGASLAADQTAIKAKTDQLTFTEANKVDSTAETVLSEEDIASIVAAIKKYLWKQ
jgi:hypothetical protein